MGTFPRLHSLTTRVLTVDRAQTKDISGTIRLLKHPPSKELRSLYIVIFPDLGTDRYLSLRLGDLDDALVAAAAANPWKNIHFSFVIYALKEEEEDVVHRLQEEGFPLLHAKSPLDITVVDGARSLVTA